MKKFLWRSAEHGIEAFGANNIQNCDRTERKPVSKDLMVDTIVWITFLVRMLSNTLRVR